MWITCKRPSVSIFSFRFNHRKAATQRPAHNVMQKAAGATPSPIRTHGSGGSRTRAPQVQTYSAPTDSPTSGLGGSASHLPTPTWILVPPVGWEIVQSTYYLCLASQAGCSRIFPAARCLRTNRAHQRRHSQRQELQLKTEQLYTDKCTDLYDDTQGTIKALSTESSLGVR